MIRTVGGRIRRAARRLHGTWAMRRGRISSPLPLSGEWGFDRGQPVDRYFIERHLERHAGDIRGHVLEIAEDRYSRRFGGPNITRQDVLSLHPAGNATMVGDLAQSGTLPPARFDCLLITQTLHLIFDVNTAVKQLHSALRPGGVLLLTVPGITPVDAKEWRDSWFWSMTDASLRHLLSGPFEPEKVEISVYGNLYAATAFLHAASVEELNRAKLGMVDPRYPVTVAARAVA